MDIHTIIIGDIVHSREVEVDKWMPVLEEVLQKYSKTFDIFRGDSFQADIPTERCFEFIFYLRARIKTLGKLDVRIGMGVGTVDHIAAEINGSNGEAFVRAGEAFDGLKKELFALYSPWQAYDQPINIMMAMAMELANKWTINMAETIAAALEQPELSQVALTKVLGRTYQSQVSTELAKGQYALIKKVIDYSTQELLKRC